VSFFASRCTVCWMIAATWLILSLLYKKHLGMTKYIDINMIRSFYWQKIINNQHKINSLWRWQQNTAVKVNSLFSMFYYWMYLISHGFFCNCLLWSSDNWSLMKCTYQNFLPNSPGHNQYLGNTVCSAVSGHSGHSICLEQKWCNIYIGNGMAQCSEQWQQLLQNSDRRSKKQQWALQSQQMAGSKHVGSNNQPAGTTAATTWNHWGTVASTSRFKWQFYQQWQI